MIRQLVGRGKPSRAYVYVDNRFEGNALETIAAMLAAAGVIARE